MLELLISCWVRFLNGYKTAIYVNILSYHYMRHILVSFNPLKYIITTGILPLIFIKPLNVSIIPNGWDEIQFHVCFYIFFFPIFKNDKLMVKYWRYQTWCILLWCQIKKKLQMRNIVVYISITNKSCLINNCVNKLLLL